MTSKKLVVALFIIGMGLFALSHGVTSANSKVKKEVTFSKDVAPIFYKNCASCHKPNDIAPMSLITFKESRPWARSIKEKVVTREMPPWSPDPNHGHFKNDMRLKARRKATPKICRLCLSSLAADGSLASPM
jgi:hypothetical protein